MKQLIFVALLFFNFSCIKNNPNITCYEKEVIQELHKENDKHIVQIGISAQVFYLDKNIDDYETVLNLVEESYTNKSSIKIGIENKTNRILYAQKIK